MFSKMMVRSLAAVAFMVATLCLRPDVFGQTITVTETGVGTGSIAGSPFTAEPFVITSIADPDDTTSYSDGNNYGLLLANESASISITGVGTYQFITKTQLFVSHYFDEVGFGQLPSGYDLYDGPTNGAFSTWGMQTSIGPITGTGNLLGWTDAGPVLTTGGALVFQTEIGVPTTFQAIVAPTPEPGTLALAGASTVALVSYRWRRMRMKYLGRDA